MITPLQLFKCLSEETRLRCVLLIAHEKELCVCELITGLQDSQPKISRHLAQLRSCGILSDRRQGQWVFYSLNKDLPKWAVEIIHTTLKNNTQYLKDNTRRLAVMGDRPERESACC